MNSIGTTMSRSVLAALLLTPMIFLDSTKTLSAQIMLQCYQLEPGFCDPEPWFPETEPCSTKSNQLGCELHVHRVWAVLMTPIAASSGSPTIACEEGVPCYYESYCAWNGTSCHSLPAWYVPSSSSGVTCSLGSPPSQGQQCDPMQPGGGGPD